MVMIYYLAGYPPLEEAGIYSEKPFIVIVDTIKTEEPDGHGHTANMKVYSFDTATAAKEYAASQENPDRQPVIAKPYGYSDGRWIRLMFVAECPN